MRDDVILVDSKDKPVGTLEKLQAHKEGKLHRAISVFIFHPDARMMLQKRARSKYHSGGLWSNACCSHPRPDEDSTAAAQRRLWEEMGIECDLIKVHEFIYQTEFPNGLSEHEFDHVFIGITDEKPVLDPREAEDWKWVLPEDLRFSMKKRPHGYTYWLQLVFEDVMRAYGALK